jgi:hypothetical protein
VPGLAAGAGPDGVGAARQEADRIAATLVSIDGRMHVRRTPPGWRVEDRGGRYNVRPLLPSSREDRPPRPVGRALETYWIDIPWDRRDALDALLVGGRLVVAGKQVDRAPVVEPPVVEWAGPARTPDIETQTRDAIERLMAASSGLEPTTWYAISAWTELRSEAAAPDVRTCMQMLETMAERERGSAAPTLGTAAWMEMTKLVALGARE